MKRTSTLMWPVLLLILLGAATPSPLPYFADEDLDGYSTPADCDDWDGAINPGATEICNFRDDDCDGQVDEGCKVYYRDADGDGFGLWTVMVRAMEQPSGYSTIGGDCDDNNSSVNPGMAETCTTAYDDNCNGASNEGCQTFYRDDDGDGYGDPNATKEEIIQPSGYVTRGGDCDDNDASVNPGATEICDHKDNDCDGQSDEGCEPYYRDVDADSYGDIHNFVRATSQPRGFVSNSSDCDDYDASIHPGATEVCNFKDDNCNIEVDEGCRVFYKDSDGDGYGLWDVQTRAMTVPAGYSVMGGDCNDNNSNVHPGAAEQCNGINDDCDGLTDEGCGSNGKANMIVEQKEAINVADLNITASPNPSSNMFTVQLKGHLKQGKINIRVMNHLGEIRETKNNLEVGQIIKLGANYPAGVYFIEAIQGKNRKLIKVIKS